MRLFAPMLLAGLAAACSPAEAPLPVYTYDAPTHPETPSILRDVALIDDDVRFTRPYVPGHRTTMDGRIAVRVQGGPPGTDLQAKHLSFYLFSPERLDAPILAGPAGATILAEPESFDVVFPPALADGLDRLGHHAICDATTAFPTADERPNPYLCGPDGTHDCYDVTVISSTSPGTYAQLWGTPVTVEVADPKTATAHIVDVVLGEPVKGATIPFANDWTEPAVTRDGRLLTGRWGRFPRSWTNPETDEKLSRPYDLAYAQLPDDAAPCDVTGWTTFHPMSHAPYDPRMKGRYGLAAYPFRGTEGQPIPDGEDMGGTYPWVDREGNNVFMTGVHGTIREQSETAWPRRCVHEACESYRENVDWDRGFMVAGLWTHGKLVHLDGMINHLDWAVGVTPAAHWEVDMFHDASGAPVPVRVGAGRFIDAVRYAGGPYPDGYTHNANVLDSLQNVVNQDPDAFPITPRDVVWVMSNGVATDEIVFDDLLDPNALIVSSGTASITQLWTDEGASLAIPKHWNGQVRTLVSPNPLQNDYLLDPDAVEDIHVQNGATSLTWNVPAYGLVRAGTARIEPAALGGVFGRGLWLSGKAEVTYDIPAQPTDVTTVDAYVGLFVDVRAEVDEHRLLLSFPDGTAVRLVGADELEYLVDGAVVHTVSLPPATGWRHLGWRLTDRFRRVELLVDGYPLDERRGGPMFVPAKGTLRVGRDDGNGAGFRGWVDDFMVLLHDVDPEVACNHANGTLVELTGTSVLDARADAHPTWAHTALADRLARPDGTRFACWTDHSADHAAHLRNLPDGTTSVRSELLFPEGPLRHDAPRPESSGNAFCLDCHHADGLGGLSLAALTQTASTVAHDDVRRQPHQPPRRVFGNIPAGWIPAGIGPGGPPTALQAPPEGLLIDAWVLPPAE